MLTTAGLINNGITSHYRFQYDDSLIGLEPTRLNIVLLACEDDYNLIAGWFGNISLDVSTPIEVNILGGESGASWETDGTNLTIAINDENDGEGIVRYLLVAEMVEQFERSQGLGWFGDGNEGSNGEGLSRFLAAQFLSINGLGYPPAGAQNSNLWLNSTREDYVNNPNPTDFGPDAVTGCALLFLWYLYSQLGFSIKEIVAAAAPTLAGVYQNLTHNNANPFPEFNYLLSTYFPSTAIITTGNLDSPFPLSVPMVTVNVPVPSIATAFQLVWTDASGNELKGPDLPDGRVWFPVSFPNTTTPVQELYLRSNANIMGTFETLVGVKFFLTGDADDVNTIQNIWPELGGSTRPDLNGGFEISFDFGRTYTRFDSSHGVEGVPSTWIPLPVEAIGNQGAYETLGAFDTAHLLVRYIVPPGASQIQSFDIRLGTDFDII